MFVKKQNSELEDLLDKKINLWIFNNKNCKISICAQQIKENEIIMFNFAKKSLVL